MALTLGAILFAGAVVLWVLHPLLTGQGAPLGLGWDEITDAEARKRVALRALRDVEYDYHTGKLDDGDYEVLRGELTAEAVAALQEEDADRRERSGVIHGAAAVEDEILRIRAEFRAGVACAGCGHRNPDGSRFCASCGQQVVAAPV